MKEMDGRTLYKEIKNLRPDAKVLVFTALDLDFNEFRKICASFGEQFLITKPVKMESLISKVRRTIIS
jgi:CheY-like chemotaxis protein